MSHLEFAETERLKIGRCRPMHFSSSCLFNLKSLFDVCRVSAVHIHECPFVRPSITSVCLFVCLSVRLSVKTNDRMGSYGFHRRIAQDSSFFKQNSVYSHYPMSQGIEPLARALNNGWVKRQKSAHFRPTTRYISETIVSYTVERLIRNRIRTFDWYLFRWPWMILNDLRHIPI